MKKVLVPEVTQQDVWDEFVPELVDEFTMKNGRNVFLLAYGQTGTGKTHTMFGQKGTLTDEAAKADWGFFPRLADITL